jgi:hypothetical protein
MELDRRAEDIQQHSTAYPGANLDVNKILFSTTGSIGPFPWGTQFSIITGFRLLAR